MKSILLFLLISTNIFAQNNFHIVTKTSHPDEFLAIENEISEVMYRLHDTYEINITKLKLADIFFKAHIKSAHKKCQVKGQLIEKNYYFPEEDINEEEGIIGYSYQSAHINKIKCQNI